MKRLSLFLLLVCMSARPTGAASVKTIQLELAKQQVDQVEAYLAEHPEAEDRLQAVNLLLDAYQQLGDMTSMVKYLEQRYALLLPDDLSSLDGNALNQLVNRTALPLLEFHYREFRYDKAKAFTAQVRKDFEGHPMLQQLNPALDQLHVRYRMPEVGDRPEAAFSDFLTGTEVKLSDFKGRYVLLEFWVTNCDLCAAQKGYLHDAWQAFHDKGFEVLAFSQDAEEEVVRNYLLEHEEPWHQCFDQDPAHRNAAGLKVRVVPYNLMVDPEGKVVAINLREQALLDFLAEAIPAIRR